MAVPVTTAAAAAVALAITSAAATAVVCGYIRISLRFAVGSSEMQQYPLH